MRPSDKYRLEQKTKNRHYWLRFKAGLNAAVNNRRKTVIVVTYTLTVMVVGLFREYIFSTQDSDIFSVLYMVMFKLTFPVYAIGGLFFLIVAFGTPLGAKAIHENLWRIGLCNHAGESPLLIAKHIDKKDPHIVILEFEANGIPKKEWEDKQSKIETALDVHVVKVAVGESKRRILLHTVSMRSSLPDTLYWKDDYLSRDSFILVLGESLTGRETVNMAKVPHILLGGSTGSGKSVLLKLLLMQAVKKDALVSIADFKGGVDFPAVWHRECRMVFEANDLLHLLTQYVEELERRKAVFRDAGIANIDQYNAANCTSLRLHRMIFACDEVAELLDKTGLDKQGKELVLQIENKLSTIARQGRAFGIHLILATQRPDATILAGQIRNNIDCRVCGRADNVLSQIILDSTDAADQIPKDAQGRFITHEGIVFQGYLFDEGSAFEFGERDRREGVKHVSRLP